MFILLYLKNKIIPNSVQEVSKDIYKENSIYNGIICTNVCAVGCGA